MEVKATISASSPSQSYRLASVHEATRITPSAKQNKKKWEKEKEGSRFRGLSWKRCAVAAPRGGTINIIKLSWITPNGWAQSRKSMAANPAPHPLHRGGNQTRWHQRYDTGPDFIIRKNRRGITKPVLAVWQEIKVMAHNRAWHLTKINKQRINYSPQSIFTHSVSLTKPNPFKIKLERKSM